MVDKNLLKKLKSSKNNDSSIFILDTFPYFIVGSIKYIYSDYIVVKAKFGVSDELLNTPFSINISNIVAFN